MIADTTQRIMYVVGLGDNSFLAANRQMSAYTTSFAAAKLFTRRDSAVKAAKAAKRLGTYHVYAVKIILGKESDMIIRDDPNITQIINKVLG